MPTNHQKNHRPTKVVENKCNGTKDITGECGMCGRLLKRNGVHAPNQEGYFGYTLHFADGSQLQSNTKTIEGVPAPISKA